MLRSKAGAETYVQLLNSYVRIYVLIYVRLVSKSKRQNQKNPNNLRQTKFTTGNNIYLRQKQTNDMRCTRKVRRNSYRYKGISSNL